VIGNKTRKLPRLLSVQAGEPLRAALALIEQHDVSQIPVMRGTSVVGTLAESEALKAALSDPRRIDHPIDPWMGPPLPEVDADAHVDEVTRLLARDPAVLVRQNGEVVGILTRYDMLQFIAGE
jgi:cystathionine beta-synthase